MFGDFLFLFNLLILCKEADEEEEKEEWEDEGAVVVGSIFTFQSDGEGPEDQNQISPDPSGLRTQ